MLLSGVLIIRGTSFGARRVARVMIVDRARQIQGSFAAAARTRCGLSSTAREPPAPLPPAGLGGDGAGRHADDRRVPVLDLAAEHGTPLFVYDEATCGRAAARPSPRSAASASSTPRRRSCAGRWPGSPTRRACCSTSPAAASCTSPLAAGVPAGACTLHGNNKSVDELRTAIEAGVAPHRRRQLRRARPARRAPRRRRLPVPDVLLRVTPGVHAHTHEYIATGQDDSKFGFNLANGDAARGRRPGARGRRRSTSSGCTATSARTCSRPRASRRAAEVMAGVRRAARPARARPRRRPRRRLRRRRGGADDHRVGRGRARRVRRARRAIAPSASSRAGRSSPPRR